MDTCSTCGTRFSSQAARFCGGCGTPKDAEPAVVANEPAPQVYAEAVAASPAPAMPAGPSFVPAPVVASQVLPAPVEQPAAVARPVASATPTMRVGMLGSERSTVAWVFFAYFTMLFASIFWIAGVHGDMRRYQGNGMGAGAAALYLIPVFGWIFLWIHTPARVGEMYAAHGLEKPCSGLTAFWWLLPLVGPAIYFVKVNESLNSFWRSLAA